MPDHIDRWVLQGVDQLSPAFNAAGSAAVRAEAQIAGFASDAKKRISVVEQQITSLRQQLTQLAIPINAPVGGQRPTRWAPPAPTAGSGGWAAGQAAMQAGMEALDLGGHGAAAALAALAAAEAQAAAQAAAAAPRFQPLRTALSIIRADAGQLAGLELLRLRAAFSGLPAAITGLIHPLESVDSELRKKPQDAQRAESAITKFFRNTASVATGNLIASAISKITSTLAGLASQLKDAPEDAEQWEATYVRIFGNVARAQEELRSVQQAAIKSPFELPDIVQLDQRLLLLLGRPEQIQHQFHESFDVIRRDLLDSGAALQLNQQGLVAMAKDLNEVGRGQNVGNALRSLMQVAGISREELAQFGVEFDKNSTRIVSSYEGAFSAVLRVMESKFGGMGEIQSRTMAGMESNLEDFKRIASQHLGGPLLADLEKHLADFLAKMSSPEAIAAFDLWGTRLEKLANLGFRVFDSFVRGVQIVLNVLRPLTDALGAAIDRLPADIEAADAQAANLAKSAGIAANKFGEAGAAVDKTADAMDDLERRLLDIKDQKDAVHDQYDPEIKALQAKERLLDRIYERENRADDLATAQRKLARDRALAVDLYSSEGRAAAERLLDDEKRVRELQRQAGHEATKAQLDDAQKAAEGKRDAALEGLDDEERGIERQKKEMQIALEAHNRMTAALAGQGSATDNLTEKQRALAEMTEGERNITRLAEVAAYNARMEAGLDTSAFQGLLGIFQSIQSFLAGAWTNTWAGMVDSFQRLPGEMRVAWDALVRLGDILMNSDHGLGVAFIQTKWAVITFFQAANEAARLIGPAIEGVVLGIAKTLEHAAIGMRRAQDFFSGVDTESDPMLQKMSAEASAIDQLYQESLDRIKTNVTQGDVGANIRKIFQDNAKAMRDEVTDLRQPGYRKQLALGAIPVGTQAPVTAQTQDAWESAVYPTTTPGGYQPPPGASKREIERGYTEWLRTHPQGADTSVPQYYLPAPTRQLGEQGLANIARANATGPSPFGGSEIGGTITIIGLDSGGNERFRELVHINRGYINAEIAAGWSR